MKKNLLLVFILSICFLGNSQEIGIVGPAANGWPDGNNPTPDIMLTNNGDGTYSIDALTLTTGAAKFREDQAWTTSYGGDTFPSGSVTNGDIPVQAGVYDIVLDINNNTYTFTDVGTFTSLELSGSAVVGSNPEFATIDGENYELTVTEFTDGDLVIQEMGTNTTYGSNSFPTGTATMGGTAIPVQAGFYSVVFNLNTGDYSFTIPDVGIVGSAANGWPDGNNPTPDILMNTLDGDTYTLDGQVLSDGQLKFRQNQDWNVNWGGDTFPAGTFTGSDINVTAGTYDITFSRTGQSYSFTSLSIDDVSFENFKVYPNPTNNTWNFENFGTAIQTIAIVDINGKLILEINPDDTVGVVSADQLSKGVYLASVRLTNGLSKTVKIVKL
jgi:hypothetical protein